MHTGRYCEDGLFRQVNKMTREEAIQVLHHIVQVADTSDCGIKEIDGIDEEAIEMAIKALEQEPCGDVISRQAVLEQIKGWLGYELKVMTNPIYYLEKRINGLPSVTPTDSVIEDIKAEIEQLPRYGAKFPNRYLTAHVGLDEVLTIIDKYKAESEDKE